jgi:hypothetical protein
MGGYGSTRWGFHSKKDTVDSSRMLSIFDFKREGLLNPDQRCTGIWTWRNAVTNEKSASMGFEINTLNKPAWVRVHYTITRWSGEKQDYDYKILLPTTPCNFGGVRYWFMCPLLINGRFCRRRVGKLYLPPGGQYYGCRHCYDLTYESSQENDKRVNALKKLGSRVILEGMNNGEIDLIMGFKALPKDLWR